MATISAIVYVCEEQDLIRDCLESVKWANEIVVINLESSDNTIDICREYTDKIYHHHRVSAVEAARNFGLSKVTGDWVILLDPDERLSANSETPLRKILENGSQYTAYWLHYNNVMLGSTIRYSGWNGDSHIRFFKNGAVSWAGTYAHASVDVVGELGVIDSADSSIIHINYTSVEQFVAKMNRYTSTEAKLQVESGRPFRTRKLFTDPIREFYNRYIALKGYKDGMAGLVMCLLMAQYRQLLNLKLWDFQRTEERKTENTSHTNHEVN